MIDGAGAFLLVVKLPKILISVVSIELDDNPHKISRICEQPGPIKQKKSIF
jgi:hypothetical protein